MFESHPVFDPPNDANARIWRYMDLAKFASMLQTGSIYFPRADLLGDPFECALPLSTVRTREDALKDGEPVMYTPQSDIGCVKYIDYETAAIPADDPLRAVLHKRVFFENEQELRAVVPGLATRPLRDVRAAPRWRGDPRAGVSALVDLQDLIKCIWIAPGESLLRTVVENLVKKYGLSVDVRASRLDDIVLGV